MFLRAAMVLAALVAFQGVHPVPRPPARTTGPEDGTTAADGYAPAPQWPGQTRAPMPRPSPAFDVRTVAEGLAGAFSFNFLPDGGMIVAERPGRLKSVRGDGTIGEPIEG